MTTISAFVSRIITATLLVGMFSSAFAVTPKKKAAARSRVAAKVRARPSVAKGRATGKNTVSKKRAWVQTWDEPTYKDSTSRDKFEGEDMLVRQAAVAALGALNGAVVVVDPESGRVLSMVNQELALGGGFQPCSTIKIPVALAGLREGIVERVSPIKFFRKGAMDLSDAIAFSNNYYFANMGIKLG
jgi:penicillin-binding protein 2